MPKNIRTKLGTILIAREIAPLQGNDVAPPLKLDGEYKLKQVQLCKCKKEHFDVGLESKYTYITCHSCKQELSRGDRIHWCHPGRFEIKMDK